MHSLLYFTHSLSEGFTFYHSIKKDGWVCFDFPFKGLGLGIKCLYIQLIIGIQMIYSYSIFFPPVSAVEGMELVPSVCVCVCVCVCHDVTKPLGKNTDKEGTSREGASKLRRFHCHVCNLSFWLTPCGSMENLLAKKLELGHIFISGQVTTNKKYQSCVN